MPDIRIAEATPQALPACLALLAPVVGPDLVVLAARDADGRLLGAAGLLWRGWRDPSGFPLWVHVLPDARRRGVGRALAEAAIGRARDETANLWSAQVLAAASAEAEFAAALGFAPALRRLFFDAGIADFLAHIERIVERLRGRGRVPAEARLATLADVPPGAVADLVTRGLDSASPNIAQMIARGLADPAATGSVDCVRSRVLMVGDVLAGALLTGRAAGGRDTVILCNVIDAHWRGGWPNALLLEGTTRAAHDDGSVRFSFDCDETVRDTINLATRARADHVRTESAWRYAFAA